MKIVILQFTSLFWKKKKKKYFQLSHEKVEVVASIERILERYHQCRYSSQENVVENEKTRVVKHLNTATTELQFDLTVPSTC